MVGVIGLPNRLLALRLILPASCMGILFSPEHPTGALQSVALENVGERRAMLTSLWVLHSVGRMGEA